MNEQPGFLRRNVTRLAAVVAIVALYGAARIPTLPESERESLASRFAFTRTPIQEPAGDLGRSIRGVHPSYRDIAGWISSVGSGVALHDVDGDGLPNDLCLVDPRVDQTLVSPAPGTGARYARFVLDPAPLPHDARTMAPMGCLPGDWNEDGLTDLVVYYWGRPPVAFLRRAGGDAMSAAAYRPVELAPGGQIWNTNALTSADVDGDGHLDLIVGNYFPDGMRVLDDQATDGAHMHSSMSRSENGGKNRLLLWQGGASGPEPMVRFADVEGAFDPEIAHSWTLAAGAVDLDGDLLPEIYFGNDFGNDKLLHNLSKPGKPRFAVLAGRKTFATPNSKVLGRDSFKGMGIDFADINGDGRFDMYVSNIAQNWALEESHFVWVSTGEPLGKDGLAPYRDLGEGLGLSRAGWGWDTRFADFDNDGVQEATQAIGFLRGEKNRWPELHEIAMGNDSNLKHPGAWHNFKAGDDLSGHLHNPFFARARDGRYYDIAPELGLDDQRVTRGIAIADVDGDGDLDYAVSNQWQTSYFLRNDSPRRNASLVLDLRLPVAGGRTRPAVGALASVRLPDGRVLVGQADGGSGHSGKRSPEIHFGLGRAGGPVRVDVRYRDGAGRVRTETLELNPGRHQVLLGATKTYSPVKEG
ncbi:MAG TPA: CRTAC1 family protein [Thermoanaerobaculia bacterium]|nr:CRTAC1 family protein [Thermoanaerobaculia bacterium]